MNDARVQEREEWVRALLGRESPIELASAPDDILRLETKLDALVGEAVLDEIEHFARINSKDFRRLSSRLFALEDERIEVVGVADSLIHGKYSLSLRRVGVPPNQAEVVTTSKSISEGGRYRDLEFSSEGPLHHFAQPVLDVANVVFATGGRWIESQAILSLQQSMRATGDQLYAIVRQLLPPQTAQLVWLFALSQRDGMYLSDPISRYNALQQLHDSGFGWTRSAIYKLTEFVIRSVDPEEGFAAEVIRADTPLAIDLRDTRYSPEFELAEESVFETPQLVGQPLVREGKVLLIAAYPAEVRGEIENVLNGARQEFRSTLEVSAKRIRGFHAAVSNKFGSGSGVVGRVGEFVGGIIKGLAQF